MIATNPENYNNNNLSLLPPLLNTTKSGNYIAEEQNNGTEKSEVLIKENNNTKLKVVDSEEVSLLDNDYECLTSGSEDDIHEGSGSHIYDKPVVCRARASLPGKFLYLHSIPVTNKKNETGVFAKKDLPKKTLFGPMIGNLGSIVELQSIAKSNELLLMVEFNGIFKQLDVSNNYLSNWMMYVRPAKHIGEQNLILYQSDNNLYFSTIRNVKENEELKVWYSTSYAKARNLTLLPGSKKNIVLSKESKIDSLGRLWYCSHCHSSFKSATLLNLHVLTHAADNIETKAGRQIKLNEHGANSGRVIPCNGDESSGNSANKFPCITCSKSFPTKKALDCHLKYYELGNVLECAVCKIKFIKLLHLKNHIPTHSVNGTFTCPHCSKQYRAYKLIRNHIRIYHAERKFTCEQCSKCFPTSDKLKIHLLSHSDLRQFHCANCGKQFKRKDKLSEHIKKIHSSGKDKVDTRRAKVNSKIIPRKESNSIDYEQFVYKCHKCAIGFKRRGILVNHLAKRHPEISPDSVPELNLPIVKIDRDYFCQYCDKRYKSTSKRKAHILKNHPGEKLPLSNRLAAKKGNQGEENGTYSQEVGNLTAAPHPCEWCRRQYASKAKLLQHQRKKHYHLLPEELQLPRKTSAPAFEDETDTVNVGKITDSDILLFQDPLDSNISDGEFIIDASTLKRALKSEVFVVDCSPETLVELGQMIESRPDQYFRVYQTPTGITFARPVEVWDPLSTCQTLSPSENSPSLSELKLN